MHLPCAHAGWLRQHADAPPTRSHTQTHVKLTCHTHAQVDCDNTLTLEPGHVKALLRRGVARLELGKNKEALEVGWFEFMVHAWGCGMCVCVCV